VDCWRFIDPDRLPGHVDLVYIGRHAAESAVAAGIDPVTHER
jgi:hypothetical protein